MKRTDELRMLTTKYEGGGLDGAEFAEWLRQFANGVEREAILALAEEVIRLSVKMEHEGGSVRTFFYDNHRS